MGCVHGLARDRANQAVTHKGQVYTTHLSGYTKIKENVKKCENHLILR